MSEPPAPPVPYFGAWDRTGATARTAGINLTKEPRK